MRLQLSAATAVAGAGLRSVVALAGGLVAGALLVGCTSGLPLAEPPPVDRTSFETDVYPILLRDCAFPACHGNRSRFFRVFGPGRTRLDPTMGPYEPASTAEIDASFDRARSMLAGVPELSSALLVRKPLEPAAGGSAHMGLDALGRNVYVDRDDPSWQAIARWAGALEVVDGGARDGAVDAHVDGAIDGGDAASDAARIDAARDAGRDAP